MRSMARTACNRARARRGLAWLGMVGLGLAGVAQAQPGSAPAESGPRGPGLAVQAQAAAEPDLRVDDERLPAASIALLRQALARPEARPSAEAERGLRRGLVENRLLARDVEADLPEAARRTLDAQVEDEVERIVWQARGPAFAEGGEAFRLPGERLDPARLRALLTAPGPALRLDSQRLEPGQRAQAAAVEVLAWRFPDRPRQAVDLLAVYERESVQGRAELQQGNVDYLDTRALAFLRRAWLYERLSREGFGEEERAGLARLARDRLVRLEYLRQQGLTDDPHHHAAILDEAARQVSEAEARAYYHRHAERYRNVAQVEAAHLRLADQASADRVYAELQGGLDFDEAVRRHSVADDRHREPPGDLGVIRALDPDLDLLRKTALIQRAGTLSQPMRVGDAFEIVRVRGREDRQLPLEDPSVRDEVNRAVARERLAARLQARLDARLAQARVVGL